MIELKLKQDAYSAIQGGKLLQAGDSYGGLTKSPVGDIVSLMWKEGKSINICTHIQTAWSGKVTQARRRKVLYPVYFSQSPILLSGGTFSNDGIDYSYGIRETNVRTGDLHEHKSDVMCTAVKGRFRAANQEELEARLSEYCTVISQVHLHLYDPRNTEKKVGSGIGLSQSQLEIADNPKGVTIKTPKITLEYDQYLNDDREFLQDLISCHYAGEKCVMEQLMAGVRIGDKRKKSEEIKESVLDKVTWDQVGGFSPQKEQVRIFIRDFLHPEAVSYSGRDPSKKGGIIFLGRTGWGKTFFARACATSLVEKVDGPVHYIYASYGEKGATHWRGMEAKQLAEDFEKIRYWTGKGHYVAYFLEEIQSVGQRDESPQHSNEFLNELLAQSGNMDYTRFLMMAATAVEPATLDQQLLRPGRFGEHVTFKGPISTSDAADIVRVVIQQGLLTAQKNGNKNFLKKEGLNYDSIGGLVTSLSPAQICDVVHRELSSKTDRYIEEKTWVPISTDDLVRKAQWYVENKATLSINIDAL